MCEKMAVASGSFEVKALKSSSTAKGEAKREKSLSKYANVVASSCATIGRFGVLNARKHAKSPNP